MTTVMTYDVNVIRRYGIEEEGPIDRSDPSRSRRSRLHLVSTSVHA